MAHSPPDIPDSPPPREENTAALTAAGHPIRAETLATKAPCGGGPLYRLFSGRALNPWGDAPARAEDVTTRLRRSTSKPKRSVPPDDTPLGAGGSREVWGVLRVEPALGGRLPRGTCPPPLSSPSRPRGAK